MGEKYGRHVAGGIHARREWHSSRSGFSGAAYLKQTQVSLCDGVMQAWCLFVSGSANGGLICETSQCF